MSEENPNDVNDVVKKAMGKDAPAAGSFVFKEGQRVEIAGYKFRIQSVKPKKLVLKLVGG